MIFFDLSVHIVHRPCRSEEIRMYDLVVIVSPAEAKAEEVRKKLFDLQKQYSIELSEAIIAMLAASSGFGAQSDLIKHNGDARP
jgi:hypothetical protein